MKPWTHRMREANAEDVMDQPEDLKSACIGKRIVALDDAEVLAPGAGA